MNGTKKNGLTSIFFIMQNWNNNSHDFFTDPVKSSEQELNTLCFLENFRSWVTFDYSLNVMFVK